MQSEFKDQVVVVTGAAQGLGLSIARKFARDQAIVFMTDVQADKLETEAKALERDGAHVHPVVVDGADPEALARLRQAIEVRAGGRLDVLINNAGGSIGPGRSGSMSTRRFSRRRRSWA